MCRQANEIQETWKPSRGDFYTGFNGASVVCTPELIEAISPPDPWVTWLPRQDQLQAIIQSEKAQYLNGFRFLLVESFYQFCQKKIFIPNTPSLTSMEQLWLAFIIYLNFKKVWNGEDWVKA